MKTSIKKVIFVGLIIFLLMQLYRPARETYFEQDETVNFTEIYQVPNYITQLLQTSCFDCHSNTTQYPWYSHIQPMRFILDNHVKQGKKELNFNEFGKYSKRKQYNKLKAIGNVINADEMPLASYVFIHKKAKLSNSQKQDIKAWIAKAIDSFMSKN